MELMVVALRADSAAADDMGNEPDFGPCEEVLPLHLPPAVEVQQTSQAPRKHHEAAPSTTTAATHGDAPQPHEPQPATMTTAAGTDEPYEYNMPAHQAEDPRSKQGTAARAAAEARGTVETSTVANRRNNNLVCLYRGKRTVGHAGHYDLTRDRPFVAQGTYPQVLLDPTNAARHDLYLPEGVSMLATPLGDFASCDRQKWDLTTSLLPRAWLIEVDEGPSRAPGMEQPLPDSIDIRGGDSFLIVWDQGDWTLVERTVGDLLFRGVPKARPPLAPPTPPNGANDSGDDTERSWPSSDGSESGGPPEEDDRPPHQLPPKQQAHYHHSKRGPHTPLRNHEQPQPQPPQYHNHHFRPGPAANTRSAAYDEKGAGKPQQAKQQTHNNSQAKDDSTHPTGDPSLTVLMQTNSQLQGTTRH
ncbi:unnamed protein product, partial [Symbiodinium sp. CCMP2592]